MIGFGCWTLFKKEVWRFLKVFVQTVLAPAVSTLLYLLVFGVVFEEAVERIEWHCVTHCVVKTYLFVHRVCLKRWQQRQ